jgi:hypothetical protein
MSLFLHLQKGKSAGRFVMGIKEANMHKNTVPWYLIGNS